MKGGRIKPAIEAQAGNKANANERQSPPKSGPDWRCQIPGQGMCDHHCQAVDNKVTLQVTFKYVWRPTSTVRINDHRRSGSVIGPS